MSRRNEQAEMAMLKRPVEVCSFNFLILNNIIKYDLC